MISVLIIHNKYIPSRLFFLFLFFFRFLLCKQKDPNHVFRAKFTILNIFFNLNGYIFGKDIGSVLFSILKLNMFGLSDIVVTKYFNTIASPRINLLA